MDYRYEDHLICPWCGNINKNPNEIFSHLEDDVDDIQCGNCEKYYSASRYVMFYYSATKQEEQE